MLAKGGTISLSPWSCPSVEEGLPAVCTRSQSARPGKRNERLAIIAERREEANAAWEAWMKKRGGVKSARPRSANIEKIQKRGAAFEIGVQLNGPKFELERLRKSEEDQMQSNKDAENAKRLDRIQARKVVALATRYLKKNQEEIRTLRLIKEKQMKRQLAQLEALSENPLLRSSASPRRPKKAVSKTNQMRPHTLATEFKQKRESLIYPLVKATIGVRPTSPQQHTRRPTSPTKQFPKTKDKVTIIPVPPSIFNRKKHIRKSLQSETSLTTQQINSTVSNATNMPILDTSEDPTPDNQINVHTTALTDTAKIFVDKVVSKAFIQADKDPIPAGDTIPAKAESAADDDRRNKMENKKIMNFANSQSSNYDTQLMKMVDEFSRSVIEKTLNPNKQSITSQTKHNDTFQIINISDQSLIKAVDIVDDDEDALWTDDEAASSSSSKSSTQQSAGLPAANENAIPRTSEVDEIKPKNEEVVDEEHYEDDFIQ